MKCENQLCGKKLELKYSKTTKKLEMNPRRKFCDFRCATRECTNMWNHRNKKNKTWVKKRNKYFREWYSKNKKKQAKTMLSYYYQYKNKWRERSYVDTHKIKIWEIIGNVCVDCGKKANEVNHLKYNFASRKEFVSNDPRLKKYLIEYCKSLEPICMPCHRKRKKGKYVLKEERI